VPGDIDAHADRQGEAALRRDQGNREGPPGPVHQRPLGADEHPRIHPEPLNRALFAAWWSRQAVSGNHRTHPVPHAALTGGNGGEVGATEGTPLRAFPTDCEGSRGRDFLKIGPAGRFGLTLPALLRLEAQAKDAGVKGRKAESVILVWLGGGPATID